MKTTSTWLNRWLLAATAAPLSLGACSSADFEPDNASADDASEAQPGDLDAPLPVMAETLNEFDVGAEHVAFLRVAAEGQPQVVLMQYERPVALAEGVVERLVARNPDLTVLEKFYALAPADVVPHDALLDAHLAQAAPRGDTTVRQVEVDRSVTTLKSLSSCTQFFRDFIPEGVNPPRQNLARLADRTGPTPTLCAATNGVPDCLTGNSIGRAFVAGCVDGPGRWTIGPSWKVGDGPWQELLFPFGLSAGRSMGWDLSVAGDARGSGLFSPEIFLGIKGYDAGTRGAVYHLMATREFF